MNTPKLVRRETSKQHDFQFSAGYYLGGRHMLFVALIVGQLLGVCSIAIGVMSLAFG
jgi:hypothetical protein